MTKAFTAMAILQLRDRSLLSLDDLVVTYIPELAATPQLSRSLTIRHLLSMKAGLPQDDPWADRLLHQPPEDFRLFLSKGLNPSGPPGTAFEYSNLAYALLGLIISNVAKVPYQQYITQNILAPLGMHDTTFEAATVPSVHLARGHRWEEGRWSAEVVLGDGSYGAMGGLLTTMADFAKFAALHQSAWPAQFQQDKEEASAVSEGGPRAHVLSAASLRECHMPSTHMGLVSNEKHPTQISSLPALLNDTSAATTRVAAYGLGLIWTTDSRGVTVVRHSGGLPGYGSEWRFLPFHSLAIVSFANKTYANTGSANAVVMDLLIDKGVAQRAPKKTSDALHMRAGQLAKVISSGFDVNDNSEAGIFADNFFLDMPQPLWAKHCQAVTERLSPVASISPVTALADAAGGTNLLRGEFSLTGAKGDVVRVFFTLTPEQPPRVQEVTLRYAGFKAAGL